MRIAQVVAMFPPYKGGTGNVCYHNARELARCGHDVHVFTMLQGSAAQHEIHDGMTIHRLRPLVRIGNAAVLPSLTQVLRGFDIIHLHYPFFGGEFAALAARLWRIPLVITYQNDVLLYGVMGVVERVLRQTVVRLTLRSAARVLFSSLDYGRASHIRPLLRGRASRVGELANGVDVAAFRPGPVAADVSARFRRDPAGRIALLVAGLDRAHYFKGIDVFLAALAELPPTVRGVIVGDGDLRPAYEETALRLGVAERVRFVGRVADADLPDFYRLADVTVLPSVTMGEAFGLVLVESMACGTPVIATNLPGVRTVVDDGNDGLLVEPNDPGLLAQAIGRIVSDDDERRAMGQRGRAKVEARYSWTQLGDQLEAIYGQVFAGRRGAPGRTPRAPHRDTRYGSR